MDAPPKNLVDECLVAGILSDLVQGGDNWLVTFNTSKNEVITFHHHRAAQKFLAGSMRHILLSVYLDTSSPRAQWSSSIRSIARDAGKTLGFLNSYRKSLTPPAVIFISKS